MMDLLARKLLTNYFSTLVKLLRVMFCSQCVVKVNIVKLMICSYFAIITFFFFSFFICSIQDGTVVGVDTKTGVEYNLNGPTT